MGKRRGTYRILVGNHEGKRPLGRLKRGWEDKIIMDLQEVGCAERTGLIWLRTGKGGGHL
jgi:hypothetical protein